MSKQIIYSDSARLALKRGIDQLANAVKVTLGPKGRNVVIEKQAGSPSSTKDGVSIAKEIEVQDRFENIGVRLIKEVASKTSDDTGDGTTTATVLTQAIFNEGLRYLTAGYNPVDIQKGMEKATVFIIDKLQGMSKSIESKTEVAQIASISANDSDIGDLIAQALDKVGKDGVVTVEESKSMTTTLEVSEGLEFDRGYISQVFITDQDRMEVSFENAYILITHQTIRNFKAIMPLLEKVAKSGRPLLVIAENVEGDALSGLFLNISKLRGTFKMCAVKAPSFGDRQKDLLEDIAILTGGNVITPAKGMTIENVVIADLGQARKITVTKDKTLIFDANGNRDKIKERIKSLKVLIQNSSSAFDRDKLQERLSKLAGGVAVIKIGAPTESAMKELKDRVEDALHATQAAAQSGILVGGGVALLRAGDMLSYEIKTGTLNLSPNEEVGAWAIQKACEAPLAQISYNAGFESQVVLEKVREAEDFTTGFNAKTGEYEDLINAGIIDPTSVTISALSNASSISGVMLLTECMITEPPK